MTDWNEAHQDAIELWEKYVSSSTKYNYDIVKLQAAVSEDIKRIRKLIAAGLSSQDVLRDALGDASRLGKAAKALRKP